MGTFSINEMERNVKTLMSPDDEVTWRQVGFYDKVDDLGSGPSGFSTNTSKTTPSTGLLCSPSSLPLLSSRTLSLDLPPSDVPWTGPQSNIALPGF
jgi:hypothetical protein